MVKRWLMLAIATLLVVLSSPGFEARAFCSFTAWEAYKGCANGAWEAFHNTRAACGNVTDREESIGCKVEAQHDVSDALVLCEEQRLAREAVCDRLGGWRYDPPFDPADFVDPDAKGIVQNPFWSLTPGQTSVVRAGEEGEELIVIHVTENVKAIDGVPCRVVVDAALEVGADEKDGAAEYEPKEVTDDWYALHVNGDVWYCGELSRDYDDGELAGLGGSFRAGIDGAKPGVLIRGVPVVGELYRQEFAVNVAEDLAEVLSTAASPPEGKDAAFDCDGGCLQTREFSPLEPDAEEYKFYLPGVGFVLALSLEDGELDGDRETLVCTGDSLAILDDPACGIENVDALREKLCELHPDAFCGVDD